MDKIIQNRHKNEGWETQKSRPMNGLCDLNNVVYQGIIHPKENVRDKKLYRNFLHEMQN